MRKIAFARSLIRDQKGNVALIAAATLPMLLGAAGLAVDTLQLSVAKRQLQRAADSGAIAAASAMAQQADPEAAALQNIAMYDKIDMTTTPHVDDNPASGTYAGQPDVVLVRLETVRAAPFMTFFTNADPTIVAEAAARVDEGGQFCLISLYDGTETGIAATGNATLNLGCGMATNARGPSAVTAQGSADVSASPIAAMGDIPESSRFADGTELQPFSAEQQDPLAHVPDPPPNFCSNPLGKMDVKPNKTKNFSPGCYSSIDLKGTANLASGVYYVNGGDVSFGSQANATGTGVTIVMTGPNGNAGDISFNGGASLNLTAPSSGDHQGVVLYRDRRAPTIDVKFNGGADLALQGALYLPTVDLDMLGGFNLDADCLQIIARKMSFKGSADLRNNCPAGSGSSAFQGTRIRLLR